MINPKFSIITVVYNNFDGIEQTILSVTNQVFKEFEYIIIDGCSTDGTLELIEKHKKNIDKIITEPDMGIYDAMNKGINESKGEYILFMNSGDIFSSRNVLSDLAIHCTADIVYGNVLFVFDENSSVQVIPKGLSYLPHGMPFVHQAAFVKLKYARNNKFDQRYRLAADYDFFWRCYMIGLSFKYIDINVCNFKPGGVSDNNPSVILECSKIVKQHAPEQHRAWYFAMKYILCWFKYHFTRLIGLEKYSLLRKKKRNILDFVKTNHR